MPSGQSLNDALLRCYAAGKLPEALALVPSEVRRRTLQDWRNWMHPHQQEPPGSDWRLWLVLGGRGSGKSRAGAEWIRLRIRYSNHPLRIALVAPSLPEARAVMVEGDSGLLAVHPAGDRPRYVPSRREIVFDNGSIAQLFSAASPDLLRGPQFHLAWCDELAKWRYVEKTWDMLQFALRLGERPQQAVTTTPRPLPLLTKMIADPQTVLSRAPTIANAGFLAPSFLSELQRLYGGTTLARQELDGELIDDDPSALFKRSLFDRHRQSDPPPLARVIVAVDPPVSSTARSDGRLAAPDGAVSYVDIVARLLKATFAPPSPEDASAGN